MSEIFESEKRNLILFFLITFGWSWLFWILAILFPTDVLLYLGIFGPFVGAFTLTYLNERKEGVKNLWKRGWDYKIGKKWFLVTLLLVPALIASAFFLAIFTEGKTPTLLYLSQPWFIPLTFIVIYLNSLGEEFGWRGFAIDRLQAKWNALVSSIILGVIWGFWHLPLNIAQGFSLLFTFLFTVPTAILMSPLSTWLYNNTDGNIFGVILFHAMGNLIGNLIFPIYLTKFGLYYSLGIMFITDIVVVVIFGFKKLVHEAK